MSAPADMRPQAGLRDLGSLALQPSGDGWVPDFSSDGEARSRDLVAGGSWDARSIASSVRDGSVLCVATLASRAGAGIILSRIVRAFADAGREVLLIDADVSRPLLAKPFQYQPDEGLVDMVLFGTSAGAAIRRTATDKIRVLTVGSPPVDAVEIWESKELAEILVAFRSEWNAVVVHAPFYETGDKICPLVRHADALVLAMPATGVDSERIAAQAAALGATPRVLGMIRAGRESEIGDAPAPAPSPGPAAPKPQTPPPAAAASQPPGAETTTAWLAVASAMGDGGEKSQAPAAGELGAKPQAPAPRTEPAAAAPASVRASETLAAAPTREAEKPRPSEPPHAGAPPRHSEPAQAGGPARASEPVPAGAPTRASEPAQPSAPTPGSAAAPASAPSRPSESMKDEPAKASEPAPAPGGGSPPAASQSPAPAPAPSPSSLTKPTAVTPAPVVSTPAPAVTPPAPKPLVAAPVAASGAAVANSPQPSPAAASGAATAKPAETLPATASGAPATKPAESSQPAALAPKPTPAIAAQPARPAAPGAPAPPAAPASPSKPSTTGAPAAPEAKPSPAGPAPTAAAATPGRGTTPPSEAGRSPAPEATTLRPLTRASDRAEAPDERVARKTTSLAKILLVSAIIGVAAAGAAVMLTRRDSTGSGTDPSRARTAAGPSSTPSRPPGTASRSTSSPKTSPAPAVPAPSDRAAGATTPAGNASASSGGQPPRAGASGVPPAGASSSNEAHVAPPRAIGDDAASISIADSARILARQRASSPEPNPGGAPAEQTDAARTSSSAGSAAADADTRASKVEPQSAAKPSGESRSAAAATESWGVHVSSFPEAALATEDSLRWSRKQYAVTIVPKEIPNKGLWYRIVLGHLPGKAEAQSFAEDLRAHEGLDYVLVMKIPTR